MVLQVRQAGHRDRPDHAQRLDPQGEAAAAEHDVRRGKPVVLQLVAPGYADVSPKVAKALMVSIPDRVVIDVSPTYKEGHLPGGQPSRGGRNAWQGDSEPRQRIEVPGLLPGGSPRNHQGNQAERGRIRQGFHA